MSWSRICEIGDRVSKGLAEFATRPLTKIEGIGQRLCGLKIDRTWIEDRKDRSRTLRIEVSSDKELIRLRGCEEGKFKNTASAGTE